MIKKFSKILVLVFLAFVALNSCQKQELQPNTNQNQETKDLVLNKILNFKNKVENYKNIKTDETISIDSAVWYIEAALNYSYCVISEEQANSGAIEQISDSIFYEINISDEKINLQSVIDVYLYIKEKMQTSIDKLPFEVKFFTITDVEFIDGKFKTKYIIRYKESENKSTGVYTITADWYWGYDMGSYPWRAGKCDNTNVGKDAVSEIIKWIQYRRQLPINVYYTDIHYVGLYQSAMPTNPNGINLSSYGINMYSYETATIFTKTWQIARYICLSAQDSNYYAQQTYNALNVIEQNFIGTQEDITTYDLHGSIYRVSYDTPPTNLYHYLFIQAGTRHYTGGSEE